ncbi:hypothetical protein GYMLUDRAFT_714424 [Collybiopsis luxurians FD-317 M1]|nr:hypothetical protein GYMLUDRAFT_714424 [Collybiopsis luxurians FD-317 M1]
MADGGQDFASICCGFCCVASFSALSSWCDTVAPISCCKCCRSSSVPDTFNEQVRKDMEKSKAETAAKKQMQPTADMTVPASSTDPKAETVTSDDQLK